MLDAEAANGRPARSLVFAPSPPAKGLMVVRERELKVRGSESASCQPTVTDGRTEWQALPLPQMNAEEWNGGDALDALMLLPAVLVEPRGKNYRAA